ncbi:hypothetical protein HUN59_05160 [Curtobacterium sp. Csp2]|uniref:phage tail tube protein n=1 Tax=Curtobacterium sp. Csp2 TaxID=2495430 RepID=UPI001580CF11|nr:hypothetical protein [Curtobacterium sp. Csp2]QKS15686.1 hypothetical protein HUN59_05160 [Curtobacterium sp. Csp2]
MSLNSENVRVAVTGAAYVATTTATAPTTATSALGVDYKDLGYISDGGITETRDRSTNQIRAWQNSALVREPVTESSITYNFVMIETKKETVAEYYGTTVAADGSIKIDPGKTGGRKSYVFDVIDGDEVIRIYVPNGEVTEVGDQTYVNGDPIGYEITVTGYATTVGDEVYSAVKWYTSLDTTGA